MNQTSPINRSRSKQIIDHTILTLARRHRRFNRAQLATESGLSSSSITHGVRRLMERGVLCETELDRRSPGRPVGVLEYRPQSELIVVISFPAQQIRAQLVDYDGTEVDRRVAMLPTKKPLPNNTAGQSDPNDLARAIAQISAPLVQAGGSSVQAVVVAIPGASTGRSGVISRAPALGITAGHPLGAQLTMQIERTVIVDNDVNLMAIAESFADPDGENHDTVFFFAGELGIGAGIVLDGRVHRGLSGTAGEIGFLPLSDEDVPDAGIGTFERRWSDSGIARRAHEAGLSDYDPALPSFPQLEQIAGAGALRAEVLRAWSRALLSCACLVAPEQIVLGGSAAQMGPESVQSIHDYLSARAPATVSVKLSTHGTQGLVIGSVITGRTIEETRS